jgi:hypothetical protein
MFTALLGKPNLFFKEDIMAATEFYCEINRLKATSKNPPEHIKNKNKANQKVWLLSYQLSQIDNRSLEPLVDSFERELIKVSSLFQREISKLNNVSEQELLAKLYLDYATYLEEIMKNPHKIHYTVIDFEVRLEQLSSSVDEKAVVSQLIIQASLFSSILLAAGLITSLITITIAPMPLLAIGAFCMWGILISVGIAFDSRNKLPDSNIALDSLSFTPCIEQLADLKEMQAEVRSEALTHSL